MQWEMPLLILLVDGLASTLSQFAVIVRHPFQVRKTIAASSRTSNAIELSWGWQLIHNLLRLCPLYTTIFIIRTVRIDVRKSQP